MKKEKENKKVDHKTLLKNLNEIRDFQKPQSYRPYLLFHILLHMSQTKLSLTFQQQLLLYSLVTNSCSVGSAHTSVFVFVFFFTSKLFVIIKKWQQFNKRRIMQQKDWSPFSIPNCHKKKSVNK